MSPQKRGKIVEDMIAFEAGDRSTHRCKAQLAAHHGVNKKTPKSLLAKFQQKQTVNSPKRCGRPPKWGDQEGKKLTKLIQKKRKSDCRTLSKAMGFSHELISQKRKGLGFRPKRTIKKPALNTSHYAARVVHAKKHKKDKHDKLCEVDVDESWKFAGGGDKPGWYLPDEKVETVNVGRKAKHENTIK